MWVGLCAELDTAIHKDFGSGEFPLQGEVEVGEFAFGAEEFVAGLEAVGAACGEGIFLDAPCRAGIAFPAVEGTIEEGVGIAEGVAGEQQEDEKSHEMKMAGAGWYHENGWAGQLFPAGCAMGGVHGNGACKCGPVAVVTAGRAG